MCITLGFRGAGRFVRDVRDHFRNRTPFFHLTRVMSQANESYYRFGAIRLHFQMPALGRCNRCPGTDRRNEVRA